MTQEDMTQEEMVEDFLDRVQGLLDNAQKKGHIVIRVEDLENAFPELRERDDEKIRKALIEMVHDRDDLWIDYDIHKEEALAWLEKQGEQKLAPKTSFKKGDWVVVSNNHRGTYQIEKIENLQYTLRHILGGSMPLYFCNEDLIRLWTIQDAMDGDILVKGSNIFKFHFIIGTHVRGYCHVNTDDGRFYDDIGNPDCFSLIGDVFTPATREQRDFFFQRMKDAGYGWDAEEKRIKQI